MYIVNGRFLLHRKYILIQNIGQLNTRSHKFLSSYPLAKGSYLKTKIGRTFVGSDSQEDNITFSRKIFKSAIFTFKPFADSWKKTLLKKNEMNILPLISFDSLFHFESGWRTRTLGDARGTKHHLLLEGFINNEKMDNLIITNHYNILIHFYIYYYNYY